MKWDSAPSTQGSQAEVSSWFLGLALVETRRDCGRLGGEEQGDSRWRLAVQSHVGAGSPREAQHKCGGQAWRASRAGWTTHQTGI